MAISVAIQAGGQSRRMGQDKGLVRLAGKPLVEYVIDAARSLGDEIFITTNNPSGYAYLDLPLFPDRDPGTGALRGLHTALKAARSDYVLTLACDLPFLNRHLLQYMVVRSESGDVVVPLWEDTFQTLHAVYRRAPCLQAVDQVIKLGHHRMISFYPYVKTIPIEPVEIKRFDPAGRCFFNVNTREDLKLAESLVKDRTGTAPNLTQDDRDV